MNEKSIEEKERGKRERERVVGMDGEDKKKV